MAQQQEAQIEVENLEISYGSVATVGPVSFSVTPGQQLTLLGPSGCGKTTTLRALAGLEKPSAGAIRIGKRTMYSAAEGINLPAEQRGLSMVFQSYAIWPHMTVYENVAFGLRVRRKSAAEIEEKVRSALDLVQMGAFADRHASQLSGGQQQRVALARACAFSPSVLLFDEPLSNLDAKLRGDMRIELRELQHRLGVTSVYVTHDLEEALAMSDAPKLIVAQGPKTFTQPDSCGAAYRHAYSITSSARASSVGGMVTPIALAVVMLTTSSTLVGNSTGRSAGFAPLTILSTK
jgi:iron(III) transport system ATP-binding protein